MSRYTPGAQTSLLPDLEYRFWGHYTDHDGDPAELDRHMRAHAQVEDHIGRLNDSGLKRVPFTDFAANQAWTPSGLLGFGSRPLVPAAVHHRPLARALPKRLRWQLWHAPPIITTGRRDIVRILESWLSAANILAAYRNIATLT